MVIEDVADLIDLEDCVGVAAEALWHINAETGIVPEAFRSHL